MADGLNFELMNLVKDVLVEELSESDISDEDIVLLNTAAKRDTVRKNLAEYVEDICSDLYDLIQDAVKDIGADIRELREDEDDASNEEATEGEEVVDEDSTEEAITDLETETVDSVETEETEEDGEEVLTSVDWDNENIEWVGDEKK